jgi:uncharacterized membrane protein
MNIKFPFSSKTNAVLVMIGLCLIMWFFRIRLTGEIEGFFLAWNLFLAFLPLFFILFARKVYQNYGLLNLTARYFVYFFMILWLLFFPNSPYIITDLIHLGHLPKELLWFDSLGIYLTATTGLMVGLYSVDIFRVLTQNIFSIRVSIVLTLGSLFLSAFGVYLGRYIRLNSWDLFTRPFDLIKIIFGQLNEPLALKMTIVFGLVMSGLYFSYLQFLSNYASHKND